MAQQFYDFFKRVCIENSNNLALQIQEHGILRRFTFSEALSRVDEFAKVLAERGIEPGDRIILVGENKPEWMISFLAIGACKATAAVIDAAIPPDDLRNLVERVEPKGIVASQSVWGRVGDSLPTQIPALDMDSALTAFREPTGPALPRTPDGDPSLALLAFTTGSTNIPKGVLLSHEGLIHNALYAASSCRVTNEDRLLVLLPLHHSYGFTSAMMFLLMGASLTFVEAIRGDVVLAALREAKPTLIFSVPRLYEFFYDSILSQVAAKGRLFQTLFQGMCAFNRMSRNIFRLNFGRVLFGKVHRTFGGCLRAVGHGGAPISDRVLHGFDALGFTLVQGYGLTETSPLVAGSHPYMRDIHSVGVVVPGLDVKLDSPDPITGEGEICVRGISVMKGYFRDEQATKDAMDDGYFHTGDLGRFNKHGHLFITGRLKELIVLPTGKKAAPFDIEQRYTGIAGVKEHAVLGISLPDGLGDEVHAAFVIEDNAFDSSLTTKEKQRQVETAVALRSLSVPQHLRIQKIHFLNELPKASIKIRYGELRKIILQRISGIEDKPVAPQKPAAEDKSFSNCHTLEEKVIFVVQDVAQKNMMTTRTEAISSETKLQLDIGFDSLALSELGATIESKLGANVFSKLSTIVTVSDLVVAVKNAQENHANARLEVANTADRILFDLQRHIRGWRVLSMRLFLRAFNLVSRTLWHLEVQGVEHIPADRPFVLCPNHESNLDTLWVASCLPSKMNSRICSLAKSELFKSRFTRFFAQMVGAVPVDRTGDTSPAMKTGEAILRAGLPLIIHPEGTRTENGGLGLFRRGAARLALATGVPLVPVRISGAYSIYPRSKFLPKFFNWSRLRRYRLEIKFGSPIEAGLPNTVENELVLTEKLRKAVEQLKG